MTRTNNTSRAILLAGAALTTVLSIVTPAQAETAGERSEASPEAAPTAPTSPTASIQASATSAQIEERQSYAVRLMTQVYDGTRDVSHTQMLGIGRARKGNHSISQFDFGDGSVVITPDAGKLSASRFLNVTGSERLVIYNYDDKTVEGDAETARLHNRVIRPWLGKGPALGRDANWAQTVPLGDLGVLGLAGTNVRMELSRSYFTHNGMPMVLIEYAIPAFGYDSGSGRTVVQWGRGIALTDPGFGMIYLNAALHRAVETVNGQPGRPYRFGRTMIAANPDGSAMVDYRRIEQLKGLIEPIMGANAVLVVPVSTPGVAPDGRALELSRRLDLLALSIGEDGANEVPIGASVQTGSDRGTEASPALVQDIRARLANELGVGLSQVPASLVSDVLRQVGARAMTMDGDIFLPGSTSPEDSALYADERVHVDNSRSDSQSGGPPSAEASAARIVASMIVRTRGGSNGGSGDSNSGFTIPDGTIDALHDSRAQGDDPVGDAFRRVQGDGDPGVTFGNPGEPGPKAVGALAGRFYAGDAGQRAGAKLDTLIENYGTPDKFVAAAGGVAALQEDLANVFEDFAELQRQVDPERVTDIKNRASALGTLVRTTRRTRSGTWKGWSTPDWLTCRLRKPNDCLRGSRPCERKRRSRHNRSRTSTKRLVFLPSDLPH